METRITVKLNDFIKIKNFCNEINNFESDVDLVKGRYVIDAKSTIGIFTLDLSAPVDVIIHSDDEDEIKRFNEVMEAFV